MTHVKLPAFRKAVNPHFAPIFENRDRYLLLWGGRNSGKSVSTSRKLIYRCLSEPYFRYILIRKVADTVKDSCYQTIKDDVELLGLQDLFTFKVSPLEIVCKNGNKFLCRGLDKPDKIKSIKDPTGAWYEEASEMTEKDFITVSTSIRTIRAEYIQEIITFNPEVQGDFKEFFLYKRFFAGHAEYNFRASITIEYKERGQMKSVTSWYTSHHSTYKHNKYLGPQQIADLEGLKAINPYYYTVYTLGHWGNKEIEDRFWKSFNYMKHVKDDVFLDVDLPLMVSFDENVNPYPALSLWQVVYEDTHTDNTKTIIRQIHEICLRSPNNKVKKVGAELLRWCAINDFNNKIFIFGDASSDKEDTKLEKGVNYFTILRDIIDERMPVQIKKPNKNPPVALSAEFINAIYEAEVGGLSIEISDTCKNSINDYQLVEEKGDGTMKKPKVNGVEVLGHVADTKRYFLAEMFKQEFNDYIKRFSAKHDTFVLGPTRSSKKF